MDEIFKRFVELLDRRFSQRVTVTEDSIRYTMFAAMLESGMQPEDVVLEYPHPAIPRATITTIAESITRFILLLLCPDVKIIRMSSP